MKIIGPDELVFAVEDIDLGAEYLLDIGLTEGAPVALGRRFEALDGTGVVLADPAHPDLPPALETGAALRETIYGVADSTTLEEIATELGKDREVRRGADGSVHSTDDMGFAIGFQVTIRRALSMPAERINAPGAVGRGPNELGSDYEMAIKARNLSHLVYYVPDVPKAEAFYVERLKFRCSDRFTDVGPFLRPAGTDEHHTLFLIQTPPHMKGVDHFTFHYGGPTEVLVLGDRLVAKGYKSFWGPGRHIFGSNWFWYFNSPFDAHVEIDADMDKHDASWTARAVKLTVDYAQLFLFDKAKKWAPGAH